MSYTIRANIDLWAGIKARREALGLSQQDFAALLGVSFNVYTRWEGKGTYLTAERLHHIDGALGVLERQSALKASVDNLGDKAGDTEGTDCAKGTDQSPLGDKDALFTRRVPKKSPDKKPVKKRKRKG